MGRRYTRTVHPAPPMKSVAVPALRHAGSGSAWQRRRNGSRSCVDLLDVRECPAMNQTEDRVRDQSEDSDRDDGGDDAIHSEKPLRDDDEGTNPAFSPQEFGDDQVCPG